MAAYDTLRAAIDSYIKANGNKEITGTVLNDILNAMVSALGADTRFAGVAVPTTNPGNPEGNVVYFASQAGTYSNFGGIVLPLGIHILVRNGTAWTSQTWFSVDNTPTQNSQNLATSGGILQAIVDAVGVERLRAIGVEVTSASFDSTTKKISFFNSANSTLFQLDATAFVIDGMVSDVKIEDGNLVIKFNTDAGKQDIEIPLTDIFNPANYYTKTAIDELLTVINNKLADGCLYRGMAEPTTNPPTPTTKVFYIATKAGTYTNFGNITVTEGITILKYDGINWSKEQISYSDGVFDISAYNGTSYADLSAALGTNGANIPQNLRKGGMSVKFVLSSDNKYVQYRLMSDTFNTTEANWQGIDDEPTAGSENLVKSGGVEYNELPINNILGTTLDFTPVTYEEAKFFVMYGMRIKKIRIYNLDSVDKVFYLYAYDKNDNALGFVFNRGTIDIPSGSYREETNIILPANIYYVKLGANTVVFPQLNSTARIVVEYENIFNNIDAIKGNISTIQSDLDNVEKEVEHIKLPINFTPYTQSSTDITKVGVEGLYLRNVKLKNTDSISRLYYIQELDENDNIIGYLYNGSFTEFLDANETVDLGDVVLPERTKYLNIGSNGVSVIGTVNLQAYYGAADVYLRNMLNVGGDYVYNKVGDNKEKIGMFLQQYAHQTLDEYNRIVVSFNGDSILGSQLEEVTASAEYNTGAFPPNMSRMIAARKFYDAYKFAGEDTVFRNLAHNDWIKSGFAISNKLNGAAFNRFEDYGGAEGDAAIISTSGYKFFKLVWSGKYGYDYNFTIQVSTDGTTYVAPSTLGIELPDSVTNDGMLLTLQKYVIADVSTISYVKIILGNTNPDKACLWGCEMWNNKRLDVVVQAYSGSIAKQNYENMIDAYCGSYHKPALLITDILAINDTSYINSPNEQYELWEWRKFNALLYQHCVNNGIPVLLIRTQFGNDDGNYLFCVGMADGLAHQFDGFAYIDITKKQAVEQIPYANIVGQDGTHLSDSGNTMFFEEIQKLMN